MSHPSVYQLSRKFGPPKVTLREAQILDDYGNTDFAKIPTDHPRPEVVTKEQLDYYAWVYPFLEPFDLLFYLHPVAREYAKDKQLECIDDFLYSLDHHCELIMGELNAQDTDAFIEGLLWISNVGGDYHADWYQCPNLQKVIGISL